MFANDAGGESFEDALRSIASELGQYIERSLENVDVDDFADHLGVDPGTAGERAENAGGRVRALSSGLGEEIARRGGSGGPPQEGFPPRPPRRPPPPPPRYTPPPTSACTA